MLPKCGKGLPPVVGGGGPLTARFQQSSQTAEDQQYQLDTSRPTLTQTERAPPRRPWSWAAMRYILVHAGTVFHQRIA